MEQKIEEFKQEVRGWQGAYPLWELEKFIKYYTEKKPFYKIKGFTLSRRLKTWFDPKRKEKFKQKLNKGTETENRINYLKNFLGKVDPLR